MAGKSDLRDTEFVSDIVFKRDVFSETHSGHLRGNDGERVIRRIVTRSPLWSRPLAWILAWREIRALKAVRGIDGTPALIAADRDGLIRGWLDGAPIQLAAPREAGWYRSAHRILRELRRRGVTHNDLAKPQNWLMRPDGSAAVIDFQLASVHRTRGPFYRLMAYEDFRHLLKQKRSFAPHLLTPTGRRVVARRSLPSRIWLDTGKKVYKFITRRLLHWSDGEGTNDRIDHEGPAIREALTSSADIRGVELLTYAQSSGGVGIYAFVETGLDEKSVRALLESRTVELVQPVATLPRDDGGAIRSDVLMLVALNQMTELDALLAREPDLAPILGPIVAGRRNLTDRRLKHPA